MAHFCNDIQSMNLLEESNPCGKEKHMLQIEKIKYHFEKF